ncbi:phosphate ABC transporter permease PstA [Desulfosporosinus meridiei]|uniref:Phosphate transport system permease protein PstA n=1 Tax=Desulfosporosinus meridiei (strain ATCC BAA-275 / DSM 13257 / KCTC 12902 / NCIMB 13706 / S10) TaxID=768704 RepID=J7J119_DESMD|nr:phosphate ABC transporter permease PstA [Desulfosporosinus meridiei]AFQ44661.1 phosphate ABC transporter membrane protein 2, PhoT family [Desulfosporosinus meridiei DSM 13257]
MKQYIRKYKNWLMLSVFVAATIIALVPLFGVLGYVLKNGLGALNIQFFTNLPKAMGLSGGGMANAIVGTLIMVLIASLIGIPVGILAGIYLTEYDRHSWFSTAVRFATDVLTGIPSIIVGIVIYTAIVLKMGNFSALAGGLALAIIMIPLIIRSTEEMLKLVSHSIREAGYALGISKGKTILKIVLPTAAKGIITGAMLAIARVSGETAPLLFTALGNQYWARSLNEPIASLPVQIFQYATSPYKEWHQLAWAGSLVLILMIIIINLAARFAFRSRHS